MNRCTGCLLIALFAGPVASGGAAGGGIYKWVTADGVTHYSELAPESGLVRSEIVEIPAVNRVTMDTPGYQAALDVANSLEAGRLERERLRLEKQKLLLEADSVNRAAEYENTVASLYYPAVHPYRRLHRQHRRYGHARLERMPQLHRGTGHRAHKGSRGFNARAFPDRAR